LILDEFPPDARNCTSTIDVPVPPLQSVSSITYLDNNGDSQTLAASKYDVDASSEPGRIAPAFGETWPDTRDVNNAVTVTFIAGYTTAALVPDTIKHAIKMITGHWYENREEVVIGVTSKQLERAVTSLLWSERVKSIL